MSGIEANGRGLAGQPQQLWGYALHALLHRNIRTRKFSKKAYLSFVSGTERLLGQSPSGSEHHTHHTR